MKLLTLIENTSATEKLYIEHGLSFYIEHKGSKLLFDTGASDHFIKNAERMLVDIKSITAAIISHNHIDHTGGLDALLRQNSRVRVFAKKNAAKEYYKQAGILKVPISLSKSYFDKHKEKLVLFESFQKVVEGVYLLSDEIGDPAYITNDKSLLMKKNGKFMPDDFEHELFMVIFPTNEVTDGCVIVSSCSHRGIINIIKTVRHTWPGVTIHGIIGGLHLMGSSAKQLNCTNEYIEELADEIIKNEVGPIYTCHCTGQKGYERLKLHLGDQIQYLQTGEELEF